MPGKPSFRVGDAIIVNPGVMAPDHPTLSLAGWQGWVTDIYEKEGTIAFKWDSLVLRSIPANYIRECELEGLGWETMILERDEVSPATPRDTLRQTEAVYKEIKAHHRWDHLADFNPGISDLLGPLGDAGPMAILHAWEDHLAQALRFPFEACRQEQLRRGPVQVGEIVQVLGIADVDDMYGILVNVRLDRHSYTIPLCDLEATNHSSSNYQPLNDYVVWFANR